MCRSTIFLATYKTSLALRRYFRRNSRYVAKFVIILASKLTFALWMLAFCEIKLVLFVFVKITLLHRLVYYFIVDNRDIQIIDKAAKIKWKIDEVGGKIKVTSICLNDVLAKVYSIVICKINATMNSIKLSIEFTDAFRCQ